MLLKGILLSDPSEGIGSWLTFVWHFIFSIQPQLRLLFFMCSSNIVKDLVYINFNRLMNEPHYNLTAFISTMYFLYPDGIVLCIQQTYCNTVHSFPCCHFLRISLLTTLHSTLCKKLELGTDSSSNNWNIQKLEHAYWINPVNQGNNDKDWCNLWPEIMDCSCEAPTYRKLLWHAELARKYTNKTQIYTKLYITHQKWEKNRTEHLKCGIRINFVQIMNGNYKIKCL